MSAARELLTIVRIDRVASDLDTRQGLAAAAVCV